MTVVIPLKLAFVTLGIGAAFGFIYPYLLWLFLDAGLGLGLGLGRIYALWVPAAIFLATFIGIVYLLQPSREGK